MSQNCSIYRSFNGVIDACGKGGEWQRALIILQNMEKVGVTPNQVRSRVAVAEGLFNSTLVTREICRDYRRTVLLFVDLMI